MRSCPRCHLMLETTQWDGPAAYGCRGCGGVWAEASEAALLRGSPLLLAKLLKTYPGVADLAAYAGLPTYCPDCHATLLEEPAPEQPAVCPKCRGEWLEARDRRALAGQSAPTPPPQMLEAQPAPAAEEATVPAPPSPEPADPLLRLLAGNQRFVEGRPRRPNQSADRRAEVSQSQAPFAVVVACSDSRVVPELIFDVGLGDLFVIRSAGNAPSAQSEASVGYAVERFGIPLVLVLGHSRCSAVRAAVEGTVDHPYLRTLVAAIRPAADMAMRRPGSLLDNAVQCNTLLTARRLRAYCQTLDPKLTPEQVRVVPAFYDLDSGRVTVVEEMEEGETPVPLTVEADLRSRVPLDEPQNQEEPEGGFELSEPEAREESVTSTVTHSVESDGTNIHVTVTQLDTHTETILDPTQVAGELTKQAWCPRCRAAYSAIMRYCTQCRVRLVEEGYVVPCVACRAENKIGWARCWSCQADLHPAWLQSGTLAALMHGSMRRRKVWTRKTDTGDTTGCGSVVTLGVLAGTLMLLASRFLP